MRSFGEISIARGDTRREVLRFGTSWRAGESRVVIVRMKMESNSGDFMGL